MIEYTLLDDDNGDIDIEARLDGIEIGYVRSVRRGERLHLADIHVCEKVRPRPSGVWRLLQHVGVRPRLVNFRHRGIGSELLTRFLRTADEAGAREVYGAITHGDLERQPGLSGWYQRFGFVASDPDSECEPEVAKKIVRRR